MLILLFTDCCSLLLIYVSTDFFQPRTSFIEIVCQTLFGTTDGAKPKKERPEMYKILTFAFIFVQIISYLLTKWNL